MTALIAAATRSARDYHVGFLLITVSTIAWSTAGLFTRLIPHDSATLLVWRGIFGGLGLIAVILLLHGLTGLSRMWRLGWPGVVYAIVSAVGMLLFITSLRLTTVAHVSVIYAAVPFVAAGLAWLVLRERPTSNAVLASLGALVGVALMVGWSNEGTLLGDLLALGMTVAMAGMMVISRRHPEMPATAAACLSAFLSAGVALPFSTAAAASGSDIFLLALFGLTNSAVGLALFTIGARKLPAMETALIGALEAPLAPVWVWIAFAETPSAATLAGGAVVLVAVISYILTATARSTA